MSKNFDRMAELTAKRAGLIADQRECERNIENIALAIVDELGEMPAELKAKRGRKPKPDSVTEPQGSVPADEAAEAAGEGPDGAADTLPPSAGVDAIEPPTLTVEALLGSLPMAVPCSLQSIGESLEYQRLLVNFSQPIVRTHVRELLHQLIDSGRVVKSGEKKGTVDARVA